MSNRLRSHIGELLARTRLSEAAMTWLGRQFPDARLVQSLCFHTGEALARRGGDLRRTAVVDGAVLQVTLDEHLFRAAYFHGTHEPETSRHLRRIVQRGQTWLDIGANIGVFTMTMASQVGRGGRVIAYEPNQRLAERLDHSIATNGFGHVEVRRRALGDTGGIARLRVPVHPELTPGGSGRASLLEQASLPEVDTQVVPLVRLDDDLPPGVRVDGIKMDVEGYELAVLRGMAERFRHNPPAFLLFEVSRLPEALATPEELISEVERHGYLCYRLANLRPVRGDEPFAGGFCENVLAIHTAAQDAGPKLGLVTGGD